MLATELAKVHLTTTLHNNDMWQHFSMNRQASTKIKCKYKKQIIGYVIINPQKLINVFSVFNS